MKPRGFTLIELLIVVAIIAILAAIAVPNFLEAQVRSKVSRAHSDLRTIRVAVESYAVDHNDYPIPWHNQNPQYPGILSTPIAYIQSHHIFVDVFQLQDAQWLDPYWRLYGYWYFKGFYDIWPSTDMEAYRNHPKVRSYLLSSYGPDKLRGWFEYLGPYGKGVDGNYVAPVYDPTNGTISFGDICVWGP